MKTLCGDICIRPGCQSRLCAASSRMPQEHEAGCSRQPIRGSAKPKSSCTRPHFRFGELRLRIFEIGLAVIDLDLQPWLPSPLQKTGFVDRRRECRWVIRPKVIHEPAPIESKPLDYFDR